MPLIVVLLLSAALLAAPADAKLRPIPDTSGRIAVWNDQYSLPLTDAQVRFLARANAGTQKIPPAEADRFRRVNPRFLVLHYRLGLGLGNRATQRGCDPTGEPIQVIEGDRWVKEFPANPDPAWF